MNACASAASAGAATRPAASAIIAPPPSTAVAPAPVSATAAVPVSATAAVPVSATAALDHAPDAQVFAIGNLERPGGPLGVVRGAGTVWTKLPFDDCKAVASTDAVTYCVHERRIEAPQSPE